MAVQGFFGKWRPFSNFHLHPVSWVDLDTLKEYRFPSNENLYQFLKIPNDQKAQHLNEFQQASPARAKHLGRMVDLRDDWEDIKAKVMLDLNLQKFQDPDLRRLLLSSHGLLEETNWWHDNFWGVCRGRGSTYAHKGTGSLCPRCSGEGENMLGRILMIIRDERI